MPTTLARAVYLIASGRTDWQDGGRVQGNTDLPTSASGLTKVTAAAGTFHPEKPIRMIHCAPDEASRQTAQVYAHRLGDAKVKPVQGLEEMNLGLWQGLTETDLSDRYARSFGQWRQDASLVSPPSGESLEQAVDRITAAVARLIPRGGDDAMAMVLRPLSLNICAAWLRGEPVGGRLFRLDYPAYEAIRLTEQEARAARTGRRRKSLGTAASRT